MKFHTYRRQMIHLLLSLCHKIRKKKFLIMIFLKIWASNGFPNITREFLKNIKMLKDWRSISKNKLILMLSNSILKTFKITSCVFKTKWIYIWKTWTGREKANLTSNLSNKSSNTWQGTRKIWRWELKGSSKKN